MSITIEAIYEAGILKPLAPLPKLAEHSRVRLTIETTDQPAPKVRRSTRERVDLTQEMEWLRQHHDEYRGRWVVLAGDRLVGHAATAAEAGVFVEQARAEGVQTPFIKLIPQDDGPVWMGWS